MPKNTKIPAYMSRITEYIKNCNLHGGNFAKCSINFLVVSINVYPPFFQKGSQGRLQMYNTVTTTTDLKYPSIHFDNSLIK